MSINKLRKFNHHTSGMIESYLGDYYYDTEVDETIRTHQAEIERLKSQRGRLLRELKQACYATDNQTLELNWTMLIREIEEEK